MSALSAIVPARRDRLVPTRGDRFRLLLAARGDRLPLAWRNRIVEQVIVRHARIAGIVSGLLAGMKTNRR